MLTYHLKTAVTSLRRNPILTALLIGGIALGICVSTAFVTLQRMFTQELVPGKTNELFYVRLDTWGKDVKRYGDQTIPDQITYKDAVALMRSNIPLRQTPTFITSRFVHPDPKIARPYQPNIRVTNSDLFTMFNMPFKYGGPWPKSVDTKPEQVIVIDHATNAKLFGGANSVGKTVRLNERHYRVVGVLDQWRPPMRPFELMRNPLGPPEPMYIPFSLAASLELPSAGNTGGWKDEEIDTYQQLLASELMWVQYWVELPDAKAVDAYRDWVRGYILEQKKLGRYERPLHFTVTTIPGVLEEMRLPLDGIRAMSIVSLLFLAVCSLNLVGILLGKFLARIPEVSVRRALGASRAQIFWQHVIECELIGVAGGVLGILMSLGIISGLARVMPNGDALRLDGEMLLIAGFLSLVAGLIAGVYPAWRVCSVPPAMQLKVQ
jgi:putative ABC transport system permease protein